MSKNIMQQHQVATEMASVYNPSVDYALETIMRKATYGPTNDALDTAAVVFQSIIVGTEEGHNADEKFVYVKTDISKMPSNILVRKQLLSVVNDKMILPASYIVNGQVKNGSVITINKSQYLLPTNDLISVMVNDPALIDAIVPNYLCIKKNGTKPIVVVKYDGGMFDLVNNCEYTGAEPTANKQWQIFKLFKSTPAEQRTSSFVGINVNVGGLIEEDRPFTIIDAITYGAASILRNKGKLPVDKLIKGYARLAQRLTYTRKYGDLDALWTLKDVFDATNANDGISYVLVDVIQQAIYALTGIMVSKKRLVGKAVQCRPGSAKTMSIIVSEKMMNQIVSAMVQKGIAIDKFGKNKAAKVPQFLADTNCWKADINDQDTIDFDVLAPMVSISDPVWNNQLIAKYINVPQLPSILEKSIKKYIEKKYAFLKDGGQDTISAVKNGTTSQALMNHVPELATKIDAIVTNSINTAFKAGLKDVANFNIPIPNAKWVRMVGDQAGLFNWKLLKSNEVHIPGLAHGVKVVCTRFPAVFSRELVVLTNVGADELLQRIDDAVVAGTIKLYQGSFLAGVVNNLDHNLCLCPQDEKFRILTGGSDTDADMMIVCWDEEIVEAAETIKPLAIKAAEPKKIKTLIAALDQTGWTEALTRTLKAPKVGIACNHVTALIELKTMDEITQTAVLRQILGNHDGTETYVPMFDKDCAISVNDCYVAKGNMRKADLSVAKNRMAILNDAEAIAKTEVDRTIDAPKTADMVKTIFKWRKAVATDVFKSIVATLVDGKYVVTPKEERFGGAISTLRWRLVDYFVARTNQLLAVKAELSNKEKILFGQMTRESEYKSFVALKKAYTDIVGMKRNEAKQYPTVVMANTQINWYKPDIAAVHNMGLMVLAAKNRSHVFAGQMALAASAGSIEGVKDTISDNFGIVCFGEEIMQFAVATYKQNNIVSERMHIVNDAAVDDGEMLTFRGGIARRDGETVAVVNYPLNGDYTVAINDDGIFATTTIAELFHVPAINGSILVRIHGYEIAKDEYLAQKIGSAQTVRINTPNVKGVRDTITLRHVNGTTEDIRIDISGADLCRVLDGKVCNVVHVTPGIVSGGKGEDIKTINVLLNIVGQEAPTVVDMPAVQEDAPAIDLVETPVF